MAVQLLCMLKMCMKLHNLCTNCNVLMLVICLVMLLYIVMHNIGLAECQLVLANDLELTRFYDIHALMLLY